METAASLPGRFRGLALAWPRLGAGIALAVLIGGSTLARAAASWHKATPTFFWDEYLYAELARSLLDTGSLLVRGAGAGFPAPLQPVLTAPLWLADDIALSYHLTQAVATLVMSLAAVPVFLLARRLELGAGVALCCAAFALAIPDFLYASRVLAEPFAYPLALASVFVGTLALSRGGARLQLGFLALAALTVLARTQFLVLPLAYIAAVVLLGLRERALVRVAKEQRLPLVVSALGAAASVARPGTLGQYDGFLEIGLGSLRLTELATNLFGLAYVSGWLLVPGAVLGLVLALARPRSRDEASFGALSVALGAGLLWETATYGDIGLIQERYFFYALPLVGLLFALYASRGWPHRRAYALMAVGALAVVAVVPLTSMTAAVGKVQSPFLFAAFRFEAAFGSTGGAALLLAAVVSAMTVAAMAGWLVPRAGALIALVLATAFCALSSVGAVVLDLENSARVRERFLPAERSWIDSAGVQDVALLRPFIHTGDIYQQLFWNRAVTSLLLFPDVVVTDPYRVERVSVGPDGTLLSGGRPVVRPLVIDEYAGRVELRGAVRAGSAPTHRLWRPQGVPRLTFLADGYFTENGDTSGWLGRTGSFQVWPPAPSGTLAGRIGFRATPEFATTVTVRSAQARRAYVLVPGQATTITIPVCGRGPWRATFESSRSSWQGGRIVSTPATTPMWTPDSRACD